MKRLLHTHLMVSIPLIFFLMSQKSSSQNLLIDGNFSTTTSITPYYTDPPPLYMWLSWANYFGTGASFTTSVQNGGVCSYFIDNPGTNMYDVQLTQYGFPLVLNHRYRLSFDVKADADRDFGVFIGEFQGSWTNLNPSYARHATSNWQTITIDLDATAEFALHKLSFEMGIQKINMYFANISLIDLGPIPVNKVVIAGTFQNEPGCPGDWMPDCDNTALFYNASTGLWSGSFTIPAGCQQYKVTIDGSWDINYGENGLPYGPNISLYVPEETLITFTYSPETHLVETSPIASGFSTSCLPQVVLAGSFQDELGCSSDWDANCTNTALTYVAATGQFENDINLPPGYYEYRTILNNDWAGNNFGADGHYYDPNYNIYIPCKTTKVHFSYNPLTHIVTAVYTLNSQPNTVVIAGSFQEELGCPGDWQPDCNNTRMQYDAISGTWGDTLDIPAGHWEYKITVNNSLSESYGQNGDTAGANISLDLCYPAKVVFNYYHSDCYHYVYTQIITNGACVNKFYDANVNGYLDYGERPMGGVAFTLTGNGITQTQTTGIDGKTAFSNIPDGNYIIKEIVPPGYLPTMPDSQTVYLFSSGATVNFGNVCLGSGGAKGKGFWANNDGEVALTNSGLIQNALLELRNLSLRNADGSDFDPYTYEQLRTWLKAANAKSMVNMVSAQLATIYLNQLIGYVQYESIVYSPGCGFWGDGKFMYTSTLTWWTNYYLSFINNSTGKDPYRAYLECLKGALDNANNNLTFVQPGPCSTIAVTAAARRTNEMAAVISTAEEVKVWPNPSNNYFTLHPANKGNSEVVLLKVYNVNGEQVYTANGSSIKDYRFGERFTPGIYMVEFIQGKNRTTFKLVKQ